MSKIKAKFGMLSLILKSLAAVLLVDVPICDKRLSKQASTR